MQTIRRLSSLDVPVEVAMTASPTNWTEVYTVADEADRAGATLLRVGRVDDIGRGNDSDFSLSTRQLASIEAQLDRFRSEGRRLEALPWSNCADVGEEISGMGFTPEFLTPGYLSWYVLSDGRVTPCQLEEEATLGHIHSDDVLDIGRPHNLARVQRTAQGCRCVEHVDRSHREALPYTLPGSR